MNDLIIGYYGAAFFGGATYLKLSKKENENYKIEKLHSAIPNHIPIAEKYIKIHDKLSFKDDMGYSIFDDNDPRFTSTYIEENLNINKLLEHLKNIDLENISKQKYYDEDILDGLCWDFFIKINSKSYNIKGYEKMSQELELIINYLDTISNS